MAEELRVWINGGEERVGGVSVALTLLEYLRASGRVGTKEGCAEGDCGACTVALRDGGGFLAVNSCLVLLAAVAGREVVTAEGLAQGGTLHPVQAALARAGGSQCGYCTPGFVMSLFAATYAGECDDAALEGNLCRCTGYRPIREATRSMSAPTGDDPFLAPGRGAEADHYSAGDERFFHPKTLSEALELLARPGAKAVAGGTDVGVEMNKFGRRYPVLVTLSGIPELKRLSETAVGLELGGALTLSELEAQLRGRLPLLETTIRAFAARQIRNLATLGGNLATASPVGDLAPALLAADAQLTLASRRGARTVALGDFFTGYRTTLLAPDELILAVSVPQAEPSRLEAIYKVGKRGADDISTVAAAFSLGLSLDGRVRSARLAYGGVAATPVRAAVVEAFLLGKPWSERTASEAATRLRALFTPLSDLRGSADYRRALAGNLFEKFFYEHSDLPEEAAA